MQAVPEAFAGMHYVDTYRKDRELISLSMYLNKQQIVPATALCGSA